MRLAWSGASIRLARSVLLLMPASLVLVALAAVIVSVLYRFQPDALMVIDADTRYLAYRVSNPDQARIRFPTAVEVNRGDGAGTGDSAESCLTGMFEPVQGTEIRYRVVADTLLIEFADDSAEAGGKFMYQTANGVDNIDVSARGYLAYGGNSACKNAAPSSLRIPIWGPAVLGMTPQPPSAARNALNTDTYGDMLLSGRVSVFGRSLSSSDGKRLYPAGEFDLVAGARLSAPVDGPSCTGDPDGGGNSPAMFGQALYLPPDSASHEGGSNERAPAPNDEPRSMSVSASVLAPYLSLSRLGVEQNSCTGGIEKIGVSFLVYIFNDTLVLAFQFGLLATIALFQFLINMRELSR